MNKFQICSFDPGARTKFGTSVLEYSNNKINYIFSEQVFFEKTTLEKKLYFIYTYFDNLFLKYPNITDFAIEETFIDRTGAYGIDSPLKLSMARGVAYAVAGKHNKRCVEYNNKKIKSIVTGDGNCSHRQMIARVSKIVKKEVQDDEAFGIAIGITHILMELSKNEKKNKPSP